MLTLGRKGYPVSLQQISSPPKQLFYRGADLSELLKMPRLAVVGSRNVTPYGRRVTTDLVKQLAEQGIVIISGLALGVDAVAHQAALDGEGITIAVLPGSVEQPYPATNRYLAERIVNRGGALVSEYTAGTVNFKQNFIARNRIVAGLAQAVLITEAGEKSGTLHTARFALEQGKEVLAVPGPLYSTTSVGTNNLLKAGAHLITSYTDVIEVLGLKPHQAKPRVVKGRNQHEQRVIDLLAQGVSDGEELQHLSELDVSQFNQVMTMLEISAKIHPLGANQWSL